MEAEKENMNTPAVIVANTSYRVFECVSATICTADIEHEDKEGCQPQTLKDYKTVAIINICLIILIGGLGNLFTIISICVCRIRFEMNLLKFYILTILNLGTSSNTVTFGTVPQC